VSIGKIDGSLTSLVSDVDFRAEVQKVFEHISPLALDGVVKRSLAILVDMISF
jgi:hypothetical protein